MPAMEAAGFNSNDDDKEQGRIDWPPISVIDGGFNDNHGDAGIDMTCTDTFIRLNASAGPSHVPESGEAFSCSRVTATGICSLPTILLLVGS
jgi:hypothetical protein